jgi:hypothetical protein
MTREQIIHDLRAINEYFLEQSGGSAPVCLEEAIKIIEEERPTGEWNEVEEGCGWTEILCAECSVCKNTFGLGGATIDEIREDFKFCQNCGAKMKGEDE